MLWHLIFRSENIRENSINLKKPLSKLNINLCDESESKLEMNLRLGINH